jgi:hypothetical protein
MPRTFVIQPSPHSTVGCEQHSIQAHDLTQAECQLLRGIILNNRLDSLDNQACGASRPFLQGYQEALPGESDGWVLIEFWTSNIVAIKLCVVYINAQFAKLK